MNERHKKVTVEAVGIVTWPNPDDRWNSSFPIARVIDEDGFRSFVLPGMCYRNGTTLSADIVGKTGEGIFANSSLVGFNLQTLF